MGARIDFVSAWRLQSVSDAGIMLVRLSLGASFLSAVADRFGYWGAPGRPHVAWGEFSRFVAYTAKLNWFLPSSTAVFLAWAATVAELVLGMMLVFGVSTRPAAYLSSALLLLFAVAMTLSLGLKAPLDYSVFTAFAAALLLAAAR